MRVSHGILIPLFVPLAGGQTPSEDTAQNWQLLPCSQYHIVVCTVCFQKNKTKTFIQKQLECFIFTQHFLKALTHNIANLFIYQFTLYLQYAIRF